QLQVLAAGQSGAVRDGAAGAGSAGAAGAESGARAAGRNGAVCVVGAALLALGQAPPRAGPGFRGRMSREPSCTLPAPGFGAAQHVWLKALGLLPLRRRAAFQPEVAGTSVPQASASGNTAAVARLRVFVE